MNESFVTPAVLRWVAVSVLFALWLTVHLRMAWRASTATGRGRALGERLLAMVLPGMALWRAWQQNSRLLCVLYVSLLTLYLIALLA